MKKFITILIMIGSTQAMALANPVAVIRENKEVATYIKAFEENRGLKCDKIDFNNTKFSSSDASVVTTVTCNEYDQDGNPMANVYWVTIKGQLYSDIFYLSTIEVLPGE